MRKHPKQSKSNLHPSAAQNAAGFFKPVATVAGMPVVSLPENALIALLTSDQTQATPSWLEAAEALVNSMCYISNYLVLEERLKTEGLPTIKKIPSFREYLAKTATMTNQELSELAASINEKFLLAPVDKKIYRGLFKLTKEFILNTLVQREIRAAQKNGIDTSHSSLNEELLKLLPPGELLSVTTAVAALDQSKSSDDLHHSDAETSTASYRSTRP